MKSSIRTPKTFHKCLWTILILINFYYPIPSIGFSLDTINVEPITQNSCFDEDGKGIPCDEETSTMMKTSSAEQLTLCQDRQTYGYTDLESILLDHNRHSMVMTRNGVKDNSTAPKVICPNTLIEQGSATPPNRIHVVGESIIHIYCGIDGASENNCTISGSSLHISVTERGGEIIFKGITFKENLSEEESHSSMSSILIEGELYSSTIENSFDGETKESVDVEDGKISLDGNSSYPGEIIETVQYGDDIVPIDGEDYIEGELTDESNTEDGAMPFDGTDPTDGEETLPEDGTNFDGEIYDTVESRRNKPTKYNDAMKHQKRNGSRRKVIDIETSNQIEDILTIEDQTNDFDELENVLSPTSTIIKFVDCRWSGFRRLNVIDIVTTLLSAPNVTVSSNEIVNQIEDTFPAFAQVIPSIGTSTETEGVNIPPFSTRHKSSHHRVRKHSNGSGRKLNSSYQNKKQKRNNPYNLMMVQFDHCFFTNNLVNNLISTNSTQLSIENTVFMENNASSELIKVRDGVYNMESSCFVNNQFDTSNGVVHLNKGSILQEYNKNFVTEVLKISNTEKNNHTCKGIMFERDTEKCEDNAEKCDENECILLSYPTCEIPNKNIDKRDPLINEQESAPQCYSNWVQLSLALKETGTSTTKTFILCKDSMFDLARVPQEHAPIVIDKNDITIQCGDDGARENMCLILGGSSHFRLEGTSTNVKFMGLTLIGSSDVSIDAAADYLSNAVLEDCEFAGHYGKAVSMILHDSSSITPYAGGETNDVNIDSFGNRRKLQTGSSYEYPPAPISGISMKVQILASEMNDNLVAFGAVANFGGTVDISSSTFSGNSVSKGGVILTMYGGNISSKDSCFQENLSDGNIYVDKGSELSMNENNFVSENDSQGSQCNGILVKAQCNSGGVCDDVCDGFTSKVCAVTSSEASEESNATNETKSVGATIIPSSYPTVFSYPSTSPSTTTKPGKTSCFSDWVQLSLALKETDTSTTKTFNLCNDSMFDLTRVPQEHVPIVIDKNDITIQCGDNGSRSNHCLIYGSSSHFRLEGTSTNVKFMGLTLIGSSDVSIDGAADYLSNAVLEDCEFAGHYGKAVSMILHDSSSITPYAGEETDDVYIDSFGNRRKLQTGGGYEYPPAPISGISMKVQILASEMNDNLVDFGAVANFGGTVDISSSTFSGNSVSKGGVILTMYGGNISSKDSCFQENLSDGNIYVDKGSELSMNENNFVSENDSQGSQCNGILVKAQCNSGGVCDDVCDGFSSPSCEVSTSDFFPVKKGCFKDWEELSLSMSLAVEGELFVICPKTVFELNLDLFRGTVLPAIEVDVPGVIVQCGLNGLFDNSCTINGGRYHFLISKMASNVSFKGILMQKASQVSILAIGNSSASATFIDCQWKGNVGIRSVLVMHIPEWSPGSENAIMSVSDSSMDVGFHNCTFNENSALSVVSVVGGNIHFEECIFSDNIAEEGTISVVSNGTISLEKSCFIRNEAKAMLGNVFIQEGSSVTKNVENFGEDNKNLNDSCDGMFQAQCISRDECKGKCDQFTSSQCFKQYENASSTEATPTTAPTISSTFINVKKNVTSKGGASENVTINIEQPEDNPEKKTDRKKESQNKSFFASDAFLISIFSIIGFIALGLLGFTIFRHQKKKRSALPTQDQDEGSQNGVGRFLKRFRNKNHSSNDSGSTLPGYDEYDEV